MSLSQAQDYANKGYFVVVGWINPIEGESGHVMVVVPGEMEYTVGHGERKCQSFWKWVKEENTQKQK